jgi:hypothetical protein
MTRPYSVTFGNLIYGASDLDRLLRLHQLLVRRAMDDCWRFVGDWVCTGPYETLMGYPNCGSGLSRTSFEAHELGLRVRDGYDKMCEQLSRRCLQAMCQFKGFASLDEELTPRSYDYTNDAVLALSAFEKSRTKERLNSFHAKARFVSDVRLVSTNSGVCLAATVNYGPRDYSKWSLFSLMRTKPPIWSRRVGLSVFLGRCRNVMAEHCEPKALKEDVVL